MAKITITIDGDNITVNQSAAPTKVEQENKKFFIIISYCNFDEHSCVEFVSDNYITAVNKLRCLRSNDNNDYYYKLLMQDENETIIPCNDTAWDID